MSIPLGGRGYKQPYSTKIVRIPEPLIPEVRRMIMEFHEEDRSQKLSKLPTLDEAIAESKKILKSKKSARWSITALLKRLYKTDDVEV